MARAANDAQSVLTVLRALHWLGGVSDAEAKLGWSAVASMGVAGFRAEDGPFNLRLGKALNVLLRHANADPDAMFEATAADIKQLGLDIDQRAFDDIASRLDEDGNAL